MPTLKIGITGRRNIVPKAESAVTEGARTLLTAIAREYPGRIEICSGMAVGADSIAARLALELKEKFGSKIGLTAVLPAALERYEQDFKTTSENGELSQLETFRALTSRCGETICLGDPKVDAVDRIACYARLGDWLVENCPFLLAFWNGDASICKPGGTVDVVLRKIARLNDERGLVCCVSTPEVKRVKNPDGTKTRVPDPIDGMGAIGVVQSANDLPVKFDAPEISVQKTLDLVKERLT